MTILLWVVALPFLYWAWLGVTFTILIWVMENDMIGTFTNAAGELVERQRLIRYGVVAGQDHPDLLSIYDEERNIIHIDRELAAGLPRQVIERLEMTTLPATRAAEGTTVGFVAYN